MPKIRPVLLLLSVSGRRPEYRVHSLKVAQFLANADQIFKNSNSGTKLNFYANMLFALFVSDR